MAAFMIYGYDLTELPENLQDAVCKQWLILREHGFTPDAATICIIKFYQAENRKEQENATNRSN